LSIYRRGRHARVCCAEPAHYSRARECCFSTALTSGQVRIPLIANGLYAPNQGRFPKYAGGMYNENGQVMIVSRGLSYNALVPRVFNPPEVVVVDIKSAP